MPADRASAATRIDHVLIAVPDFAAAAAALRSEHGLAAVEGGRHTGWGTANWIVPLRTGYLELVGVVDATTAGTNPFGRRVLQALADGGGPFAWCVEPADLEATARRLGREISRGSRVRPDGTVIVWRTAGLETALADPSRPFFIGWDIPPERHPGRTPAVHTRDVGGVAWVEVAGDEKAVRAWLGDPDVPVRFRPGRPDVVAVGIATASGEIVIQR